ncbi:MAG: integration host factor subunit beta [Bacteroidetes bacterium]|nr:MAG: integration host factor subunit beta [Bacteroidota bacterium]
MKNRAHISPTYTKTDIINRVMETTNKRAVIAAPWVDHVLDAMRDIMMRAQPECRIEIRDFGIFEVKLTKPKLKARNPKSGEVVVVPRRRKTHFKPGKVLKKFLSQPLESPL